MILCDRKNFIDCANGELMSIKKCKVVSLGDAASKARDAHNKGKTIALTTNGKIVSYIKHGKEVLSREEIR